jgi:hypothetical protein
MIIIVKTRDLFSTRVRENTRNICSAAVGGEE